MLNNKKQIDESKPKGQPLVFLVLAFLSFLQWSPPGFYIWLENFRWYFMVAIAGFVFIIQSRYIKTSNASFYVLYYVLSWGGILLSLFRSYRPTETLYIAISLIAPFSLGLVLTPVFVHAKGRLIWLVTSGVAAILWAYRVIELWTINGENIRYLLIGRGIDHNMISLCLSSAATVSMVVALYGDFAVRKSLKILIRLTCFISSIGFLAVSFLTYSRSGFLATFLGIAFVILTLVLSKRTTTLITVVFLFLLGASIFIPLVQATNPTWFIKFSELPRASDRDTSVYVRVALIQKAWMIIKENPIIGVGPDAFRTVYNPLIGDQNIYLPHNTYLGAWAEQGILGLSAYLVWIFLWGNLMIKKWNDFDISKRALMSALVPFFFMLAFLDMNGLLNIIFLAFFSSMGSEEKPITSNEPRLSLLHPRYP